MDVTEFYKIIIIQFNIPRRTFFPPEHKHGNEVILEFENNNNNSNNYYFIKIIITIIIIIFKLKLYKIIYNLPNSSP